MNLFTAFTIKKFLLLKIGLKNTTQTSLLMILVLTLLLLLTMAKTTRFNVKIIHKITVLAKLILIVSLLLQAKAISNIGLLLPPPTIGQNMPTTHSLTKIPLLP
jgi:hypothetical protein